MENSKETLTLIEQIVEKAVESAMRKALTQLIDLNKAIDINQQASSTYFSAEQAAEYLKIKVSTLYKKVEKGLIPHSRSGGRKLLFNKKALDEYIQESNGFTVLDIEKKVNMHLQSKFK